MSQASVQQVPESLPPTSARRWWFLAFFGGLACLGLAVIWFVLPERFDVGTRRMFSFFVFVLISIAAAVWYFGLAHLPSRVRRWSAVALVLALVAAFASVRRVEFSGDMVPTFDFRWTTDRYDQLDAHRAQQQAPRGTAAAVASDADPAASTRPAQWDLLDYRGPNRTGIIPGPALARDWSARPPRLAWRQPVGGGYASFVVVGPLVITIEQRREREAIVAYDFATGRERWFYDYPALFSETLGGDGPRATPVIHSDKVFTLGATGVLTCLELATGKLVWTVNILEANGSQNIDWGMSGTPLIYDELVLVNPGAQKGTANSRSITAFDAASGKPLWGGGTAKAGYASPDLVTLGGVRQVLLFDAGGLAAFDATDGRELWRTPWKSDFDINAAQPVVLADDRVFISSASGSALLEIKHEADTWDVRQIWKTPRMKCGYACPIAYQGFVYGIDENILACLDLADGKIKWKERAGQFGHGQILLRDDLLIVLGETGELALVEATPEKFHELGRMQAIEGKTWNNPALVGDRIFVRNHLEMAAYDLPLAEPSPGEAAPQASKP
ncbi:MAG: PQQ-binding-like beta-propeller repeat protein [Pirellulales bacterium]